jgi:hypothetical protein
MAKTAKKPRSRLVTSAPTAAQPDLIAPPAGTKPMSEGWATALQLKPITGLDDAALRRLNNENNPNPATGQAWIPKPVRGQWPIVETLVGWGAWMRQKMEHPNGFPEIFASKSDFAAQTPFTTEMLDFIRKKGFACIEPGSRVNFRRFLEGIAAQGMEKIDFIDGDYEDKRLKRARAEEQERLNADLDEKLKSQRRMEIDETIGGLLSGFKKDLFAMAKKHGWKSELLKLFSDHLKHLPLDRKKSAAKEKELVNA